MKSRTAVLVLALWGLTAASASAESKKQPEWQLRAVLNGQLGSLTPLAFSPDGKTLVVTGAELLGGSTAVLKLYDISAAKPTLKHSLSGHKEAVIRIAFSRNGKELVSVGADGTVKRWDVAAGKVLGSFSVARKNDDAGPEGVWLAGSLLAVRRPQAFTGFSQPLPLQVEFWSVSGKRQRVMRLPTGHQTVALSPDGQTLVTAFTAVNLVRGGNATEVKLWRVATGRPARSIRTQEVVEARYSPTGKRLFLQCFNSATMKPSLFFWDVSAAKLTTPNREIMASWVADCSSDGKRLATLSEDKHTIRVHDLDSSKRLGSFARLDKEVRGAVLDSSGKMLAAADEGGTVRVWAYRER
jgi:WD40 repeat protein